MTKETTETQGQKDAKELKKGDPQIHDARGDFAGPTDMPTINPLYYTELGKAPTGPLRAQFLVEPDTASGTICIRIGLNDPQRTEVMRALALIMNNHDRPNEAQQLLHTGVNYGDPGEWSGKPAPEPPTAKSEHKKSE